MPAGDELERGWRREPAASSAAPWARSRSPTTAHPPVDVRLSRSGLHAPVASVQGLIGRLLGAPRVASFALEVIPADPATGNDVFELDYDAAQQLVVVRGNAGYSIAAGLNWYLKYSLNCSFSWGRGGSGNNVAGVPPAGALPPPAGGPVRMAAPVRWRYAYNVCTFGYTMPFWDFAQFEEELDRLALWGVSLPLAFQGQEFTVDRFYRSPVGGGLNDSAINDFLAGPAFLPWNRMGNMQKWGGPLTPDWLAQQHTLQTRIVTRAREFGMVPVLPGFAGHVPRALVSRFPNATFTSSPDW